MAKHLKSSEMDGLTSLEIIKQLDKTIYLLTENPLKLKKAKVNSDDFTFNANWAELQGDPSENDKLEGYILLVAKNIPLSEFEDNLGNEPIHTHDLYVINGQNETININSNYDIYLETHDDIKIIGNLVKLSSEDLNVSTSDADIKLGKTDIKARESATIIESNYPIQVKAPFYTETPDLKNRSNQVATTEFVISKLEESGISVSNTLTFKDYVDTKENLPALANNGDFYIIRDTGVKVVWIDGTWEELGKVEDTNIILEETIIPTIEVGNIKIGDTLLKGLTFTEFVKKLLVKVYTALKQSEIVNANVILKYKVEGDEEWKTASPIEVGTEIKELALEINNNSITRSFIYYPDPDNPTTFSTKQEVNGGTVIELQFTDISAIPSDFPVNDPDEEVIGHFKTVYGNIEGKVYVSFPEYTVDYAPNSDGTITLLHWDAVQSTIWSNKIKSNYYYFWGCTNKLPVDSEDVRDLGTTKWLPSGNETLLQEGTTNKSYLVVAVPSISEFIPSCQTQFGTLLTCFHIDPINVIIGNLDYKERYKVYYFKLSDNGQYVNFKNLKIEK